MSRSKSKRAIQKKAPELPAPAPSEPAPPLRDWGPPIERAPSTVRASDPIISRIIGLVGLGATMLGSVAVLITLFGKVSRLISPDQGAMLLIVGIAGLLFHAVRDPDVQFRRAYAALGYLLLVGAVLLSFLPVRELGAAATQTPGPAVVGRLFLPLGAPLAILGLLFLLAYVRHEDAPAWSDRTITVFGVLGAAAAIGGLVGSNISEDFLMPKGLVLSLLGLAFLWSHVGTRGTDRDSGYRAGVALGALGALTFLVALGRSGLPPVFYSWHWTTVRPPPYLVPAGLLLMAVGATYLIVAVGLCSERPLAVMTRRELMAYFYSPIAYIVLFGFAFFGWAWYWVFVSFLYEGRSVVEPIIAEYLGNGFLIICLMLLGVPVLTMRLLSEERSTGTYEMLMTVPVNESTVVLSKFLGALLFYFLLWMPVGLYLIGLRVGSGQEFEYRPLFSFAITVGCVGAEFLAMGLFFSSVTRNQIGAAVMTAIASLLLTILVIAKNYPPLNGVPDLITHISYLDLWRNSVAHGVLAPRYLIFHLSAALFWLFATTKVLEARKWT
jgi:gliding motility-associated transport system permease protein